MALGDLFDRWPFRRARPTVSVLRLAGVIGPMVPLRGGLSAQDLAAPIERAFSGRGLVAVALVINSPGGSPVQSALIHQRLRQLSEERKLPVLAFVEDVAASGGYWLALAADEIFVDANSIVGSIGVITAGFGFDRALERLGVQRRLYTAGERKSLLDSFLPERDDDVARLKRLQADIHDNFKALVRARRGAKLTGEEAELFSGEAWLGQRALALGLVDGIGELRSTLRARFGTRVRLRPVATQRRTWRRRLGLVAPAPWSADLVGDLMAGLEERQHWARFGL
ncbi:MAG: S49 family peptidase [Proteobacteria bacterium]|nr:S49 family peptidase [Pseudomonadota bacterium]